MTKKKKKEDFRRPFGAKREYPYILTPDRFNWVMFGLLGDTHYTSIFCDEKAIREFYRDLSKRGVKQAFHAGDVWDGCTGDVQIYPGHIHNVEPFGFTRGVDYVSEHYPKYKDVKTAFILGNHDAKILEREGVDFGRALEARRDDLEYLQPYYARVILNEDPLLTMDLIHISRHIPYTIGYALQRHIRLIPPSKRANIYAMGHTHHHQHVSVEGDDESFLAGGFQEANEYTVRRGAGAEIGGYVLRVKLSTNSPNPIKRMESTWMRYD